MEIRGVSRQVGPASVGGGDPQKVQPEQAAQAGPGGDQVQISPAARYLDQYTNLPAVRADKVAAARKAVESGQMDTNEKLSIAIDRLLDDVLSG